MIGLAFRERVAAYASLMVQEEVIMLHVCKMTSVTLLGLIDHFQLLWCMALPKAVFRMLKTTYCHLCHKCKGVI